MQHMDVRERPLVRMSRCRVAQGCAGAAIGLILKVLLAKCANQCQVLVALNVVLTGVQAPERNGFGDVFTSDVLSLVEVGNGA